MRYLKSGSITLPCFPVQPSIVMISRKTINIEYRCTVDYLYEKVDQMSIFKILSKSVFIGALLKLNKGYIPKWSFRLPLSAPPYWGSFKNRVIVIMNSIVF